MGQKKGSSDQASKRQQTAFIGQFFSVCILPTLSESGSEEHCQYSVLEQFLSITTVDTGLRYSLWLGVVLCNVAHLAESLACTYWMPVVLPRSCLQKLPSGPLGEKSQPIENHCSKRRLLLMSFLADYINYIII